MCPSIYETISQDLRIWMNLKMQQLLILLHSLYTLYAGLLNNQQTRIGMRLRPKNHSIAVVLRDG